MLEFVSCRGGLEGGGDPAFPLKVEQYFRSAFLSIPDYHGDKPGYVVYTVVAEERADVYMPSSAQVGSAAVFTNLISVVTELATVTMILCLKHWRP